MVQVGENTGHLEEAFLQTAKYLDFEKETADRVKAALRYPTFVLVAISVAMALISLFVIPTFEKVFRGLKADLPWATQLLIGVSRFAVAYWLPLLTALALGFLLLRHYLGTDSGRYRWGRLKLRLPVVGDIVLRATMSRFARALAMTYGAGVQLVQALNLTAQAVDNRYVGEKIDRMANGIQRGDTLTNTAAGARLFTPLVVQMLAVGEETGEVDNMLLEVAEYYEREVEYDMKNLTSAIEPILIVAIGGMVLVLALGVFLPMWNLATAVRG
jgi:MSHA biogenesis protein MshG